MKLRSPESFWLLKNGLLHSYPSLGGNASCDIAVIGGGVTGALISHALQGAGYDTIVLDKRDVASGSTSATTSMLQYEIDTPHYKLTEMIGETASVECYRAGIKSIETLEKLIRKLDIKCGFERKKSLQVAHNQRAVERLKGEFELRKRHGFEVEWYDSAEIKRAYRMDTYPGILSHVGASIDAFQFAHALLAHNHQRGMRIYDNTAIARVKHGEERVEIFTEDGFRVFCNRVVYCTGFETLGMFKEKYADILTTFALVTEQDFNYYDDLEDLLIWDTDNPYIYMRTTDDKRLLVGGEDIKYKYGSISERVKDKKAKTLMDKTRSLFPGIKIKEDHNWAGAFGVTKDGLPFIGEHPDYPSAIFVLGLGGNGITFSVQGMELVLKILEGKDDPLLHYYRFGR